MMPRKVTNKFDILGYLVGAGGIEPPTPTVSR